MGVKNLGGFIEAAVRPGARVWLTVREKGGRLQRLPVLLNGAEATGTDTVRFRLEVTGVPRRRSDRYRVEPRV